MPKMKTNKAMAARFKLTGTGRLKRGRAGRRHLLVGKSSNKKRKLRKPGMVSRAQEKMYSRMIGAA